MQFYEQHANRESNFSTTSHIQLQFRTSQSRFHIYFPGMHHVQQHTKNGVLTKHSRLHGNASTHFSLFFLHDEFRSNIHAMSRRHLRHLRVLSTQQFANVAQQLSVGLIVAILIKSFTKAPRHGPRSFSTNVGCPQENTQLQVSERTPNNKIRTACTKKGNTYHQQKSVRRDIRRTE